MKTVTEWYREQGGWRQERCYCCVGGLVSDYSERRLLRAEGVLELRRQRIVLGDAARPPRAVARWAILLRAR